MITGNKDRLEYNLNLLDIIGEDVSGLFVKEFSESIVDLSIIDSNSTTDYKLLCKELGKEAKSCKELIDFLKNFYKNSPEIRFIQGLILNGLALDIDSNWAEESKITYKRVISCQKENCF